MKSEKKIDKTAELDPKLVKSTGRAVGVALTTLAIEKMVAKFVKNWKRGHLELPSLSTLIDGILTKNFTLGWKINAQFFIAVAEKFDSFIKTTPDGKVKELPAEKEPIEVVAEEAPVEEAPVEEAPVEEAPIEEAPVEEAPVEETPVEEAPIEEAPVEEAPVEETPVEEAPVEEAPVEEPAIEAIAPVEEAPVKEASEDEEEEDEDVGFDSNLTFIDVMELPEEYAQMLAQKDAGEVTLVTRYRRSFRSRVVTADPLIQEYYSELKNAMLKYKGVKNRISWSSESINKGRTHIAKINVKAKTLYLYLGIDPSTLQDSKYGIEDLSGKKKYAEVPTLIKIKGDRKFKFALELIDQLCTGLELPLNKKFEAVDYREPEMSTDEMVENGLLRMMVAAVPTVNTLE